LSGINYVRTHASSDVRPFLCVITETTSIDDHFRTFQAGFIVSIILGLGVGEMLFGRFAGKSAGYGIH
jgi:hypothetical protein